MAKKRKSEEDLNGTRNNKRPRQDSYSEDEVEVKPEAGAGPSRARAEPESVSLPPQDVLDTMFDRIEAQLPKEDQLKFNSRQELGPSCY